MQKEYDDINKQGTRGETGEKRRLFIKKYGLDNYKLIQQNKILDNLKRDKIDREKDLEKFYIDTSIVIPNMLVTATKQCLELEIQALKEHIDTMELLIGYIDKEIGRIQNGK